MSAANEGATERMTDEREREIAYQLGMMLHGKALGLVLITELRGELMRLRAQVASLAKEGEREKLLLAVGEAALDHARALNGNGRGGIGKGMRYSYAAQVDRAIMAVQAFDDAASSAGETK